MYEIESNTLLGYVVGKGITLWGGYTHDPQYAAGHFTIMEQRAREQVTFDNFAQLGTGKLNGRIRLEQRWRDGFIGTPFSDLCCFFSRCGRLKCPSSASLQTFVISNDA